MKGSWKDPGRKEMRKVRNYSVFRATSPVNILLWTCWIAFSAKFLFKSPPEKTKKEKSR